MKITDIRIRKVERDDRIRAFVSVTFDDEFVVHDMKVVEGDNGAFVAMPSRRTPDGEFKDVAHPIKSSARQQLQDMILEQYRKEFDNV